MKPIRLVVTLLLLLQVVSVGYLWAVTLTTTLSAAGFSIFLAIDLLSFTIVAYVYTHERWEEAVGRVWILAGAIGLIILLISSLYLS
jgi:hypothetical protein